MRKPPLPTRPKLPTLAQVTALRAEVRARGMDAICRDLGADPRTVTRLLSEVVPVHPMTLRILDIYLERVPYRAAG